MIPKIINQDKFWIEHFDDSTYHQPRVAIEFSFRLNLHHERNVMMEKSWKNLLIVSHTQNRKKIEDIRKGQSENVSTPKRFFPIL